MKLTASQVASRLNMNSYTVKRWYEFYNDLSEEEKNILHEEHGMPLLPAYEVAGSRGDRLWNEEDVTILEEFKNWVPPTKRGIFKKHLERK